MGKPKRDKRKWEKSKKKMPILRKPIAPPTERHKCPKDYDRKREKNITENE